MTRTRISELGLLTRGTEPGPMRTNAIDEMSKQRKLQRVEMGSPLIVAGLHFDLWPRAATSCHVRVDRSIT